MRDEAEEAGNGRGQRQRRRPRGNLLVFRQDGWPLQLVEMIGERHGGHGSHHAGRGRRCPRDRRGRIRMGPRIESGQFSFDLDNQALIGPVEADHVALGRLDDRRSRDRRRRGLIDPESRDLASGLTDQRDIAESFRLRSTDHVFRGRSVRNFHGTWRTKGQRLSFEPMSRLASADEAA